MELTYHIEACFPPSAIPDPGHSTLKTESGVVKRENVKTMGDVSHRVEKVSLLNQGESSFRVGWQTGKNGGTD